MTEKQGRKRTFGELERRKSQQAGAVTSWRARYTGPDLKRHSRNFGDKMAAEAWLNAERLLIDRDLWTPPRERERRARLDAQREITFAEWAERSVAGKRLRPSTRYRYEQTLRKRVLPDLGDIPLRDLTRLDISNWYTKLRAQLAAEARAAQRKGEGRGAAFSAYQVLSSVLNDAVDHELLETSPARVKGGTTVRRRPRTRGAHTRANVDVARADAGLPGSAGAAGGDDWTASRRTPGTAAPAPAPGRPGTRHSPGTGDRGQQ